MIELVAVPLTWYPWLPVVILIMPVEVLVVATASILSCSDKNLTFRQSPFRVR